MSRTSRERSDRNSSWAENLLPPLNFAVLLIPVIAMAMQLGSAAAGLVAATNPTDVADLDTPAQTRTRVEPQRSDEEDLRASPQHPASGPSAPRRPHPPSGDPALADPLLGYGI